jgi:hypothetical protein
MLSRNSSIAPGPILMLGLIMISGVAGAAVRQGAHAPGGHSDATPQSRSIPLVMSRAPLGTPARSLRQPTSALAMCLCLAVAFSERTAICPRVLVLTNYATSHKLQAAKPMFEHSFSKFPKRPGR